MKKAAILTRRFRGSRLVAGPRVQPEDKQKTVGPIRPTVRGLCESGRAAGQLPRGGRKSPAERGAIRRDVPPGEEHRALHHIYLR
jgi:hypothetical protein